MAVGYGKVFDAMLGELRISSRRAMYASIVVRPITPDDYDAWKPLWDGYNAFYGRKDATALPDENTQTTWNRFFDSTEPVFAWWLRVKGG
jgi:hypothetical protein